MENITAMLISASQSRESSTGIVTERRFALGLGLTNECNLACAFCYRDPTRLDRLSLEQVRAVMKSLPVRSVNLGTGENGMHPDFAEFVDYLRSRPSKTGNVALETGASSTSKPHAAATWACRSPSLPS